jgi:hypothetical protein
MASPAATAKTTTMGDVKLGQPSEEVNQTL